MEHHTESAFQLPPKGSLVAAGRSPFLGALQAFASRQGLGTLESVRNAYGPLHPVEDLATGLPLLQLPEGFRYRSFSWAGDTMADGNPVPTHHDGMGVIRIGRSAAGPEIILVRNHEAGTGRLIPAPSVYDSVTLINGNHPAGGTTTLHVPWEIDQPVRTEPSLGGTQTNCAGGVTPWGTWLSCEETFTDHTEAGGRRHGYVFEVTADATQTSGEPIVGMGRFKHEAVAVDPLTSNVYLTEDNRNLAGYYRYVPSDTSQRPGSLARGGKLQAARVRGLVGADLLTPRVGDRYSLEWVDIADPDAIPENRGSGPYRQAREAGALRMSRGEGIWYSEGKLYLVDSSAGVDSQGLAGHGKGAVWMHDLTSDTLTCVFASDSALIANNPCNITVSPRGGVLMCEDGGGVTDGYGFGERLLGLTRQGETFVFAKNNVQFNDAQAINAGKRVAGGDYRGMEFCGACFDPTGHFLFVNVQTPGITFAIWGPWEKGSL